ncbi:MAG: insulinase family protein, partial [bacterium]|nr:insulinase family protein [bacterium]
MNRKGFYMSMIVSAAIPLVAASLKPGDVMSGFTVKSVTDLPEVQGRLIRMEYTKNGADLAWLERDDDNKTFAIGFRTLPYDDTGVPHIIEHSVLCGSEKYPVKEPFVDLLKSSFATFLNAWTSADSTMYPVCSRNPTDFLNLVDVYMDSVLHPLSVKSPLAFKQEGWHYELDKADGELKRNGVVYSEMKGAFANPERLLYHESSRLLFPDTCYGFVSGGDPKAIPELTFEKYKTFYNRFYHPSNARIFLDGKVDLPAVLAKLDGFLAAYPRAEVDAPVMIQKPVSATKTIEYEIGADEKPEGKVLMSDAWVFGRFDEREKYMAMDIVTDALVGDNDAPLKKALLERGLCEDVRFGVGSHAQLLLSLVVKNVKAENVEAVRRTVRATLESIVAKGLDHARLAALIDKAEFHDREKDYGGTPRGLAFFSDAYDQWLYGGDPADAFRNASRFASLRAKLGTGWFEQLLRTSVLENPHHAELTMLPSTTLGAARREAEKAELAKVKASWSKDELDEVLATCRALEKHQTTPDRPEDVAKLPLLSIKDVPVKGPVTAREIVSLDGVTVVRPHTQANGVLHLGLYFDVSDLSTEEIADLPMLARVLGDLATAKHPISALRNELDGKLGKFGISETVYGKVGDAKNVRPCMAVTVSALESRKVDVVRLVPEVLLETAFSDTKAVGDLLKQMRIAAERQTMGLSGRSHPFRRAAAQLS